MAAYGMTQCWLLPHQNGIQVCEKFELELDLSRAKNRKCEEAVRRRENLIPSPAKSWKISVLGRPDYPSLVLDKDRAPLGPRDIIQHPEALWSFSGLQGCTGYAFVCEPFLLSMTVGRMTGSPAPTTATPKHSGIRVEWS